MNGRIKSLRKELGLSQEKFGEKLGVTKTAISKMELGTYQVTDSMAKLICSEFNVSEEWLRKGDGEMFNSSETFSLDEYARQQDLTELEFDILKGYMALSKELRAEVMKHFGEIFEKHRKKTSIPDYWAEAPSDSKELEKAYPTEGLSKKEVG